MLLYEVIKRKTEQEIEILGVRDGLTTASLAKLNAFKEGGSTHAGSASQVPNGAAAVSLARCSVATRFGLPIVASTSRPPLLVCRRA